MTWIRIAFVRFDRTGLTIKPSTLAVARKVAIRISAGSSIQAYTIYTNSLAVSVSTTNAPTSTRRGNRTKGIRYRWFALVDIVLTFVTTETRASAVARDVVHSVDAYAIVHTVVESRTVVYIVGAHRATKSSAVAVASIVISARDTQAAVHTTMTATLHTNVFSRHPRIENLSSRSHRWAFVAPTCKRRNLDPVPAHDLPIYVVVVGRGEFCCLTVIFF